MNKDMLHYQICLTKLNICSASKLIVKNIQHHAYQASHSGLRDRFHDFSMIGPLFNNPSLLVNVVFKLKETLTACFSTTVEFTVEKKSAEKPSNAIRVCKSRKIHFGFSMSFSTFLTFCLKNTSQKNPLTCS